MDKKIAFTLAEALIVLSIVAILASLSIVATTKSKPDEHIIMFRRAYSTTAKTVQSLLNDSSLYPDANGAENTSQLGSVSFNKRGLRGNGGDRSTNNFAFNFMSRLNTIDGSSSMSCTGSRPATSSFSTADGIYWSITDNIQSSGYAYIDVQLNGQGKGCAFDISTCPMPTNFTFKVGKLGNIEPVIGHSDAFDYMAIAYLRYPKLTKQSLFDDIYQKILPD